MPIPDEDTVPTDGRTWGICRMPFWQGSAASGGGGAGGGRSSTNSSSSLTHHQHYPGQVQAEGSNSQRQGPPGGSVSSVAWSLLPTRRRLRLDPATKLYFPYEPGKQARSAIRIKNISKSHVAFKFQTTEPKSCFMRPPGAIVAPGESLIATVFKFVEHPENNEKQDQKCKVKFKIMSLKVNGPMEYVPELIKGKGISQGCQALRIRRLYEKWIISSIYSKIRGQNGPFSSSWILLGFGRSGVRGDDGMWPSTSSIRKRLRRKDAHGRVDAGTITLSLIWCGFGGDQADLGFLSRRRSGARRGEMLKMSFD